MKQIEKIGHQIATLRKNKGLTQHELADRLNVSYQTISKWERGESLPDAFMLIDLSNIFQTTVDYILTGGESVLHYKGTIKVNDMKEGLLCLKRMKEALGADNLIYKNAIEGINEKMNTNIEEMYENETVFECFVAEAIIQNLMNGQYVDISDVKNNFKSEHFKNIVLEYASKFGIK